jgi:hypothetical protein
MKKKKRTKEKEIDTKIEKIGGKKKNKTQTSPAPRSVSVPHKHDVCPRHVRTIMYKHGGTDVCCMR